MDEISTTDVTMLASRIFDSVLQSIQSSCLNFTMQVTPFSAMISLRKSFVKNKGGSFVLPLKSQIGEDVQKVKDESMINQTKVEKTEKELANAYDTIKELEFMVQCRDTTIKNLEIAATKAKESAVMLNKMVNDNRIKYEEEKLAMYKEHKSEVKSWKKDLGEANRKHLTLEKKFNILKATEKTNEQGKKAKQLLTSAEPSVDLTLAVGVDTKEICSICGQHILNFIPDYFMGEKINPACFDCNVKADVNYGTDPFSSFPDTAMPYSLVSHWTSPPFINPTNSIGSIPSLRAHYCHLPNPGDTFVSTAEFLSEQREIWAEERRQMREDCKQS